VSAVVTDLNMPRMDGFEFIERIRAEPRHRGLPIIVVSGDTDPATPERLQVHRRQRILPETLFARTGAAQTGATSRCKVCRSFPVATWRGLLTLWRGYSVPSRWRLKQPPPTSSQIMDRLDRLEKQNQSLAEEVKQLHQELPTARGRRPGRVGPKPLDLDEKVAVDESRVAELAQSKVEASQRFPIRVTGMALFNGFLNSKRQRRPGVSHIRLARKPGQRRRQLLSNHLGLEYSGPQTFLGGRVHGNVYMDFAGGSGTPLDWDFRLRTGEIEIDWADRSILAGVESPIFAPREPPRWRKWNLRRWPGAGNLWLWTSASALRTEDPLHGRNRRARAIGAVQTAEVQPYQPSVVTPSPPGPASKAVSSSTIDSRARGRPMRIEIAPGFHTSVTHVAGYIGVVQFVLARLVRQSFDQTGIHRRVLQRAKRGAGGRTRRLHHSAHGAAIPVHSKGRMERN
jgi:CheY-like chemotaxis protein